MVRTRRTPKILLIATLVLVLLSAGACSKGKSTKPKSKAPRPPSTKADFQIAEIKGVSGSDRPEAQQKAEAEAPKISALLNDYYSAAFLDKAKWSGGSHPKLATLFTQDAQSQITPNLGGLALSDVAPKLGKVVPSEQKAIKLTFFVEDDQSTPVGVVTTSFQAKGSPVAKDAEPVAIAHRATFWLVKEGDLYKIYAYSAELKADSQDKTVAFGAPRT
ncbi:MAG: hypothetical protein ACR2M4_05215 [Actinomycetota bacterium]